MSYTRFSPEASSPIRSEGQASGDAQGNDLDRFAALFKALGHPGRLMILCHLAEGEKSVTELERLLDQRQAAVSQQLARLRLEGLVTTRREGKAIHYALLDPKVGALLAFLPTLRTVKEA